MKVLIKRIIPYHQDITQDFPQISGNQLTLTHYLYHIRKTRRTGMQNKMVYRKTVLYRKFIATFCSLFATVRPFRKKQNLKKKLNIKLMQ